MIRAVTILLLAQLAGEAGVRLLGLPLPGPVLGMLLMVVALAAIGRAAPALQGTADSFLRNLSLLFVPAAVGIVQHGAILAEHGLALILSLLVSTLVTLAVSAAVFRVVAARLQARRPA